MKLNLTFFKNKFFISGLISGALIASMVFILIISSNYPPSDKNKLKGTASGTYTPSVGDAGTRQGVVSTNCGTKPLVVFDNDPTQTPIICHQDDGLEAARVIVTQVSSALFCPNGGVHVEMLVSQN